MVMRKMLLLVVVFLLCCSVSYAGDLTSKEAVNYYNDGVKAQKGGNLAEADINYQKALLLDPNNREWVKFIMNNRGVMFAQFGDLDRADEAFRIALQADPGYKAAQMNMGILSDKRRTRCESLEYWAKVFDLDKLIPKKFVMADSQEPAKK